MEEIVVVLPQELAEYWRALARESAVSFEEWIAWNCSLVSVLGIPIGEAILRQPPAERELKGVAWELGRCRDLSRPDRHEVPEVTIPVLDVRTEIRRRRSA